jgi:hypothetical protein
MNADFDQRIEDTLSSLDGLQRAEPNPFLYTRIRGRMQSHEKPAYVSWAWAFALGLMIIANLVTIRNNQQRTTVSSTEAAVVASEYSITIPDSY